MIEAAGGEAFAVRVDHTVEAEVEALSARIQGEHGRLDVLVNSVAGEDPMMGEWAWFWDANLTNGEAILRQALLAHIITAKHAARLMIRRRHGLIVEVTESDTLIAGANILAQIVKVSQKALAAIWAGELRTHGVAAVAITPGFLRSERMLENFGVTEENWRDGGKQDKNFLASETPLFVGRAVAALAQDSKILEQSGQLLSSWELGRKYGFTDADGSRPDWGAAQVDYSQLPAPFVESILDAAQVQTEWLRPLLERTEQFRNSVLAGTMGESKA
jgi:NAD(P)-dependent dehydrogenase (short-subunit alcohol dehydrogenase family)